jgi:hypothetical protein
MTGDVARVRAALDGYCTTADLAADAGLSLERTRAALAQLVADQEVRSWDRPATVTMPRHKLWSRVSASRRRAAHP